MEFFGITYYGPQNYIQDCIKEEYVEPKTAEDVKLVLQKVKDVSGKVSIY